MRLPLSKVPLHTPATVCAVKGERTFRRRLMELGLVPGTSVCISKVAPLGDPIELMVRGGRLSLRRHEAEILQVELLQEPRASVA